MQYPPLPPTYNPTRYHTSDRSFDSAQDVPEFCEFTKKTGRTYAFAHCYLRESQASLPPALASLRPVPGTSSFVTSADVLVRREIFERYDDRSTAPLFSERLCRAGYFRNEENTALYRVDECENLIRCTNVEISELLSRFCILCSSRVRKWDRVAEKRVAIELEKCADSILGFDARRFFVPSQLKCVRERVSIVFGHTWWLPVVKVPQATLPLFNATFTGLGSLRGGYDSKLQEFHPTLPGLAEKVAALSLESEAFLRQNFYTRMTELFGELPVFAQKSGQLDALLLVILMCLTRERFKSRQLCIFTVARSTPNISTLRHIVRCIRALLGFGDFAEVEVGDAKALHTPRAYLPPRTLALWKQILGQSEKAGILLDNIRPAVSKQGAVAPLRSAPPFVEGLVQSGQTCGAEYYVPRLWCKDAPRRVAMAVGVGIQCSDFLWRRSLYFKLSSKYLPFGDTEIDSGFGLQEDDVELRMDILAGILALYGRFLAIKSPYRLRHPPYVRAEQEVFCPQLSAFSPFCSWVTGVESFVEYKVYNRP